VGEGREEEADPAAPEEAGVLELPMWEINSTKRFESLQVEIQVRKV